MSIWDMRIGPGPSNYGDTCLQCHVSGIRTSGKKHRPDCPRARNECGRGYHEDCEMDNCKCSCHGELTRDEVFRLRKLLKAARG